LNYSNKNIMNLIKKTLDPMIALTLIAVLDIFLFLVVQDRTKGFYYGNKSEIKQSEHIKLN